MRWLMLVLLLALVCRWGVAQVGPRYLIEVPGSDVATSAQGRVQLVGKGLVQVRFQGLSVLAVSLDAEAYCQEAVADWPVVDLILVLPASAGRYDGLAPLRALRADVPVIVAEAASAAPTGPRLYPLPPWNALELGKHGTRLRVTAMPGRQGTAAVAGYLLEVGNRRTAYRLYLGGAEEAEAALLAQRLPGADLALLLDRHGARLLALHRGLPAKTPPAALTAAGYTFTALKR